MNKFLAPSRGLWHLGEQCGIDLYWDMDSDEFLEVDVLINESYRIGEFQGRLLSSIRADLASSNDEVI